jgi:anti-anti-sigma regulatory factor
MRLSMKKLSIDIIIPPENPESRILAMSGIMTIRYSVAAREALLEAIKGSDNIELNLEGIQEIDIVGLQMICASHRSAAAKGKSFSVRGFDNEVVNSAAAVGGFYRMAGCIKDAVKPCIWTKEEKS